MVEDSPFLIPPQSLAPHAPFDVEPPPLLYHYTTIGGAHGILSSDSIWMTKIRYLNDTSELEIGIATFHEMLDGLVRTGGASDEIELLERVRDGLNPYAGANICVTSFCEHGDLLSQWRWYGGAGSGLSIGVSATALRAMARGPIKLWKCIYDEALHRDLLNALVVALLARYRGCRVEAGGTLREEALERLLGGFFASFLQIAPVIKNPHFAEEREWRLVTLPVEIDDEAYDVCLVGERIIQRYELKFPRDPDGWCRSIGRVVVGPAKDPQLIGEAIALLCRKNRVECPVIGYSEIPFRAR
jgi:hypothetical protein